MAPKASGCFSVAGNLGIFLGPLLGGLLASPATQYPGLFGGIYFFERHPYAPCRPSEHRPTAPSRMLPISDIVRAPGVALALSIYGHVMLLAFALKAALPVMLYTLPYVWAALGLGLLARLARHGHRGRQPGAVAGLPKAFPALHRRLGTREVLRACGTAYPVTFAGYAVLNWMLRRGPGVAIAVRAVGPGVTSALYAMAVRRGLLDGQLIWVGLAPLSALMGEEEEEEED
ncbi:uncharacterized protein P884DRAFT_298396 [Thermothelomyces heterothallicus CBS 202.75]|uniref:uncharacterized protein n=1 Tax=Thermothelomyces heterothallicus CBS 202.75 TaxID=1149848 RepID=UPI003742251A